MPAIVFLALAGVILTNLWITLREERHDIGHDTAITAEQAALRLEAFFATRFAILEHFRQELTQESVPGEASFTAHALVIHRRFPGFQALNWIDPEGVIRRVVPEQANAKALGLNLRKIPYSAKVLAKAERTGTPQMTNTVNLVQGGKGFAVNFAVKRSARVVGTLGAVFSIPRMVEQALSKGLVGNYSFQVAENGEALYTHGSVPTDHAFAASQTIKLLDREWTLTLFPTKARVALEALGFGWVIAAAGVLLSGLSCWLLFLYLSRQAALRESEQNARAFLNATSDSAILIDRNATILDINEAMSERFGKSREQLIGTISLDNFSPELAADRKKRLEQIFETGEPLRSLDQRDGRWLEVNEYPIFDQAGKVERVVIFGRDITEKKKTEEKLKESQAQLTDAFESIAGWVSLYDARDRFVMANRQLLEEFPELAEILVPGVPFETVIRANYKKGQRFNAGKDLEEAIQTRLEKHRNLETVERLGPDGKWMQVSEVRTHDGGTLVIRSDIHERKEAEIAQHESEERARAFLNATTDRAILFDTDWIILDVNEAMARSFGKSRNQLIGSNTLDLMSSDLAEKRKKRFVGIMRRGKSARALDERDGMILESHEFPVFNELGVVSRIAVFARDVTDQKKAEEQIKASLAEKEVLLKEIHHRVKNNFQVIASLLSLQAEAEKDGNARTALMQGHGRIMAMAGVHEKLYGSADLANVQARDYLQSIVGSVMAGSGNNDGDISCEFHIDDLVLSGDQAIPCGMIVSELIINALKYGFPNGQSGAIEVSLHQRAGDRLELSVSNGGESLRDDFDLSKTAGLGVKLVSAFAMKLAGEVTVEGGDKTRFSVAFPRDQV